MNNNFDTDVIVVGGGFAGVTAARELNQLGLNTILLEARDRLGGRTWTSPGFGSQLELGGTWVHWCQPHIWSEITRYGIELKESPSPQVAYWMKNGKVHQGTAEQLDEMFAEGAALVKDSGTVFPRPHDPLFSPEVQEIDPLSVADRFDKLGLSADSEAVNRGLWNTLFMGALEDGGLSTALRWNALSLNDHRHTYWNTSTRYKIKTGTKSLLEGIFSDATATELRLSTPVTAVEHTADGVKIVSADGTVTTARAVVMAIPVNVLKTISFTPALSALKNEMFEEGHTARGYKFWALFKGEVEPFMALASREYPVSYAKCEDVVDGNTIVVGFGTDGGRLDPTDPEQMKAALHQWFPDQEILDTVAVNWEKEEYSLGTYNVPKHHQLTRFLAELQRPESGVFLAGSDVANGWSGFIDGAIESGITVSRKAAKALGALRAVTDPSLALPAKA